MKGSTWQTECSEPTPEIIDGFDACYGQWCAARYDWQWKPGYRAITEPVMDCWNGLGCVRFRAQIMREIPILGDTDQLVARWPELGEPPWDYRWVDALHGLVLTHDHCMIPCKHGTVAHHDGDRET